MSGGVRRPTGQPTGQPNGQPAGQPAGGVTAAIRGVIRLARGDAGGLTFFAASPQGFLASLAPWLAFGVVGAAMQSGKLGIGPALLNLLVTVVALLAPAVVSHALARAWGREDGWLLYAVAFNWCHWVIPVVTVAILLALLLVTAAGVPVLSAITVALLAFAGYALWLQWFVARHALRLGAGRAALMVLLVNLGTGVLAFGPGVIGLLTQPAAA